VGNICTILNTVKVFLSAIVGLLWQHCSHPIIRACENNTLHATLRLSLIFIAFIKAEEFQETEHQILHRQVRDLGF
jgi:hypothetical protein